MSMNPSLLKKVIEGALLASEKPLSIARLLTLFAEDEGVSAEMIQEALSLIEQDADGRGIELKEVSSGFRMQVKSECTAWVSRLWDERPQRYSRALLETLVLIAYRQPVTRAEIEDVRGVAVSSHIVKTLQEREWVRVLGHREVPGRPALYGTTKQFLDYFNLKSLEELPSLKEITDLDDITLDLEGETTLETEERRIMPAQEVHTEVVDAEDEEKRGVAEASNELSLDPMESVDTIKETAANG